MFQLHCFLDGKGYCIARHGSFHETPDAHRNVEGRLVFGPCPYLKEEPIRAVAVLAKSKYSTEKVSPIKRLFRRWKKREHKCDKRDA